MVSWSILWEHFAALVLVWTAVMLAGFALLPILRLRIGLVGAPLVGVVYWTLALYLLPFNGGLDIAAGLIGVLALIAMVRSQSGEQGTRWKLPASLVRGAGLSALILLVGSLPYLTTLLFKYVPPGMDASMHTTAAALIARAGGLPSSYAPFSPDLTFPPMNLGLPTVAAVAIRWGGEPAAVMLSCHHLTFTLLILATHLLLRSWIARTPAAVLAVVSVWMARSSQSTIEWGGYPTVFSVVIGLFAARLLWQQARGTNWRLSLATGASIAAIPLVHGVGGGTWLYCVGPWITFAAFAQARDRKAMLRGLVVSGVIALAFLIVYRMAGPLEVQPHAMDQTYEWVKDSATLGDNVWLGAVVYIFTNSGSFIIAAGWSACGVLALRRHWPAALLLTAAWLTLAIVVANTQYLILPGSFLLYPERAIYWAAPLSAVALALAWRALPTMSLQHLPVNAPSLRTLRVGVIAVSVGLLCLAGYHQNRYYQRIVRGESVNADGWEALVWAREHLDPTRDFVRSPYNTTGSYLPSVAQIGCTGAHNHHFIDRQVREIIGRRKATHVLIDQVRAPAELPAGTVVFRNRSITIVKIGDASAQRR